MNKDIFAGKWKIRAEAKAWWCKLTDDDLDRAGGQLDILVNVLQEKYGYSRQRAAGEIYNHLTVYGCQAENETTRVRG